MTYQYTLLAPDDPSFPCDTCGRDVRDCTCPGGDGDELAYLQAWRDWVMSGEMDVPEEGDAIYAVGFERVVRGAW